MALSSNPASANENLGDETPPQEIERKFLIKPPLPADIFAGEGWDIEQGYFDNRLKIAPTSNGSPILLLDLSKTGGKSLGTTVSEEFAQQVERFAGGDAQAVCRLRLRVNLKTGLKEGFLTIKGPSQGASRMELETQVDPEFVRAAIDAGANKRLEKTRFLVEHAGETWEVDFFKGSLSGLALAEIELKSADQAFDRPSWVGREVTEDMRFANSNLAKLYVKNKGLGALDLQEAEIVFMDAKGSVAAEGAGHGEAVEGAGKKKKFSA